MPRGREVRQGSKWASAVGAHNDGRRTLFNPLGTGDLCVERHEHIRADMACRLAFIE
jgi:hypothetical protein